VKNPFYYGNEVREDDFCNRKDELKELKQDVLNGLNVLVYAPRRFGKTSLLRKLQENLKKSNDTIVIYFDMFSVSNIDEFIQKYFNILAKNLETTTDKIINLFKNVLQFKPNITMTISSNNEINYGLSLSKKEQLNSLEDVLNLPYIYAKKLNKRVIVIFDEFQEIEQLNIEKKLRSIMQTHSRKVSYLFSGSKKSILTQMFYNKNRAFYKSVKHLKINEINLSDWEQFIEKKFAQTQKTIDKELIKLCFDITIGYPYYMQQLMYFIWENTKQKSTKEIVKNSIKLMLEREDDIYAIVWTNLTPNQKTALKYIVNHNGENLYANDNLNESNFSASTIKSTIEALIKKNIIDKRDSSYYLIDPFMKYWLEQMSAVSSSNN